MDFQLISSLADAGFQFVGTTLGMTRSDMSDWPVLATTDKTQIKAWLDEGKGLVSVANFGHGLVIDRDDKAACAAKGFKDEWLDGYFGVDTPSGGDHWHGLCGMPLRMPSVAASSMCMRPRVTRKVRRYWN